MKRLLLAAAALVLAFVASAQVVLVDKYQPIEKSSNYVYYSAYSRDGMNLQMACYKMTSGFTLRCPTGGGISGSPVVKTYLEFDIKGEYTTLTFVMAPTNVNSASDSHYGIAVITGDGRRLLDEVVRCHDGLRIISLDVTGVSRLRFTNIDGGQDIGFGNIKLWKKGQKVIQTANPLDKLPKDRPVRMVDEHRPLFVRHSGWVYTLNKNFDGGPSTHVPSIRINRKEFTSGLQFTAHQGLIENQQGWCYFWTNKRYGKMSFIVGPRDNQSSNSSAWLTVKADNKVVFDGVVRQNDLAKQIVVDVTGAELVSFNSERRSGDFLGEITFGVVDIIGYPVGYTDIPEEGVVNLNKEKTSQLPDVCPLLSNIRPFSVRGVSKSDNTLFYGESRHITFSMGGQKYNEGILLTTGNTLLADRIDSYAEFDLSGEFDYISFDAAMLSKNHVMDDDTLRIYADGKLVFSKMVYCTWLSQHYEVPVNRCRTLRFEKPGNGKKKQSIIGVGDIILYRGNPVANNIFEHEKPDCPYETDLIDLCGKPYFHYNGRYCSSLTDFSMDDCFHDGTVLRKSFYAKDGTPINKGFMLETNIPLGLEQVTVMDGLFFLLTGMGANVSNSDFSAYTGVTGGAEPTPLIFLLLEDASNKQAAAAAFNVFGEYQSCTFTVTNIYEHVSEFANTFGATEKDLKNPVKLNVIADHRLVGEYWLDNKMSPMTITVPLFNCHQLMFWLECGDERSGQYLFHNLRLSKAPCNIPIPEQYHTSATTPSTATSSTTAPSGSAQSASASSSSGKSTASRKAKKEKSSAPVEWKLERYSHESSLDAYLGGVDEMWKATAKYVAAQYATPIPNANWVQASDGTAYKCVTFSSSEGNRMDVLKMLDKLRQRIEEGKQLQNSIILVRPKVATASIGLATLSTVSDMDYFGKYIKLGPKALTQCADQIDAAIEATQQQIDFLNGYLVRSVDVDGVRSTSTVLILPPDDGEQVPANIQQLSSFAF